MALADRSTDDKSICGHESQAKRSASGRRVLVISREFWPSHSDACCRLSEWCQNLISHGFRTEVLTDQVNEQWPERISMDRVRITRLAYTGRFRRQSFERRVNDWLNRHRSNYDLVYFDAPDDSAARLLQNRSRVATSKTAVRVEEHHLEPSKGLPRATSRSILSLCKNADVVLTPSSLVHQSLVSAGLPYERIVRVHDFNIAPIDRSIGARRTARQILREANLELDLAHNDRLLLCPFALHPTQAQSNKELNLTSINQWIDAVATQLETKRGSRLWVLGDTATISDSICNALYDRFRNRGWQYLALLPGVFTDLQEVLQAADCVLLPPTAIGHSWILPKCIRSRIPILGPESQMRVLYDSISTAKIPGSIAVSDNYRTTSQEDGPSQSGKQPQAASPYDQVLQMHSYRATDMRAVSAKVESWLRDSEKFEHAITATQNLMNQAIRLQTTLDPTQAINKLVHQTR